MLFQFYTLIFVNYFSKLLLIKLWKQWKMYTNKELCISHSSPIPITTIKSRRKSGVGRKQTLSGGEKCTQN